MRALPQPTKLVVVESPFRGDPEFPGPGVRSCELSEHENIQYARQCVRDCIVRFGEAPWASHLLYTQEGILRDEDSAERNVGIGFGLAWAMKADSSVLYVDRGITEGMALGVAAAWAADRPIAVRRLPEPRGLALPCLASSSTGEILGYYLEKYEIGIDALQRARATGEIQLAEFVLAPSAAGAKLRGTR